MIQKRQIVCTQKLKFKIKINYYLNHLSSLWHSKNEMKIKTTRILWLYSKISRANYVNDYFRFFFVFNSFIVFNETKKNHTYLHYSLKGWKLKKQKKITLNFEIINNLLEHNVIHFAANCIAFKCIGILFFCLWFRLELDRA